MEVKCEGFKPLTLSRNELHNRLLIQLTSGKQEQNLERFETSTARFCNRLSQMTWFIHSYCEKSLRLDKEFRSISVRLIFFMPVDE